MLSANLYIYTLLITCVLFLASCVGSPPDNSLHSDVFLVNSTSETLSIQIQQTGDAQLLEGQEYFMGSNTIPPFTTERILRINRQSPLPAGQAFLFTSHIENAQGSFQIHQKMLTQNSDSSLSFGATANDETLPLQTDTNIHRITLNQNNATPTELAFRASNKGLYPDLHYVISEPYAPVIPNPSADKLSILTYNIWALPYVSNHINTRLQAMPPYLAQYDVLLLQEAFSTARETLVNTLAQDYGYSYSSEVLDNPSPNIFNGGVILLSRYPIVKQAQFYFPDCTGADCLADKGINYIEIIKQGRSYHLFATHTASFDTYTARLYRQKQFKEIHAFAQSMNIPPNETVVYGGDFNVNKWLFPDDYQQMLSTLNVTEPTYTGHSESTFNPFTNIHATAQGSGSDHIEYLDYVFVSNDYAAPTNTPTNNVRIPRSTTEPLWGLWDLSDHYPVEALIE